MTATETDDQALDVEAIVGRLLTAPPPDPYPLYARLRELDPIHRSSYGDIWTMTRYRDVSEAIMDRRFVGNYDDFRRRNTDGPVDWDRPFIRNQRLWFIFTNPPEYQDQRALYGKVFTRGYSDGMRPMMVRLTNELLDEADARGGLDVVGFGYALTLRVIAAILGLPSVADGERFVAWTNAIAATFDPISSEEILRKADEATLEAEEFMHDLVATLRRRPGDNLLSRLIALEDGGTGLTEAEIIANTALIFDASVDTTTGFIGNAVLALLRNRDQWELLTTDPAGLAKNATEELLRYDGSVTIVPPLRRSETDVEIGGVTIKAGETVVPFLNAANRDPERYEDPDRLDLTRHDIRPLTFGGGLHICLGAQLARVESEVALTILAQRFPRMEATIGLGNDELRWRDTVTVRGLHELPVRLR